MQFTHRLRQRITKIYLYQFFKDFSFFAAVLVPFFTDWGGLSQFQIQVIQSWFSFWVFVLEIPTGAIADKIGRKHSLAIGSLIIGIATLIYGTIPSFAIFLMAEFIFAVGYAFTSGADQALLYDALKEEGKESESKKILGRADAIHMLGMMLAAPIGGLIAQKYGINAPMIASSIPLLAASLIGWSIKEPQLCTSDSQSPKYLEIVRNGLKTINHNAVVRTLAIDSLLVSSSVYFLIWLNQPLLLSIGVPIVYFGLTHALILLSEIIVSSNFAWFEKLLGTGKKYLTNTALLTAIGFFSVALLPNLYTAMFFIIIVAGLGYTRATYIISLANKHIPSRERATVLSSISMLRRFALIMLNPIIGLIADHSLSIAFIVIGTLPLLTLLVKEKVD